MVILPRADLGEWGAEGPLFFAPSQDEEAEDEAGKAEEEADSGPQEGVGSSSLSCLKTERSAEKAVDER